MRQFLEAASASVDCAEPVLVCAPAYADILKALQSLPERQALAESADVLGAACSVAQQKGAERTALLPGVTAWGVARVHGRDTLCLFDGRAVWAKGRKGATKLRAHHVVIAWRLD